MLDSNVAVIAEFTLQSESLTVSRAGAGSGTVSGNSILCGSTCSSILPYGSSVSLVAEPAAGSIFSGWSGACTGTGSCDFSIDSGSSVVATFAPQPVTDYGCPGTSQPSFGHYVPSGRYWGNTFAAQGSSITSGYLDIGANQDGNNHQATIGIYANGNATLTNELGSVTVNVVGYGGVNFTFAQPIAVSQGEGLYIAAVGVGDFTAYDENDGGVDGCFIGNVQGFA